MSRVILVSECGKECPILASILAAVSPTCWGERFGLAPPDGDVRSCENGMSLFEVESFIGVATLLSPYPTMPELMMKPNRSSITAHLDVQRLTAALSLCHKYDCGGLVKLIAYLADFHFPSALLPERTSNSGIDDNAMRESQGHGSTLHSRVRAAESSRSDVAQQSAVPVAQWITQSHINFIVRAQELFDHGSGLLNDTCLAIIAHALTNGVAWSSCTRFANGLHFMHGRIAVLESPAAKAGELRTKNLPSGSETYPASAARRQDYMMKEDPDAAAAGNADQSINPSGSPVYRTSYDPISHSLHFFLEPLVLERWRITMDTIHHLLCFVAPKNTLFVAACRPVDRSNERGADDSVFLSASVLPTTDVLERDQVLPHL